MWVPISTFPAPEPLCIREPHQTLGIPIVCLEVIQLWVLLISLPSTFAYSPRLYVGRSHLLATQVDAGRQYQCLTQIHYEQEKVKGQDSIWWDLDIAFTESSISVVQNGSLK